MKTLIGFVYVPLVAAVGLAGWLHDADRARVDILPVLQAQGSTAPTVLAGTYHAEGENPNGGTYVAYVTIELIPDSVNYLGKWEHPGGGQAAVLAIDGTDAAMTGIDSATFGVYRWTGKGWEGKWSHPGAKRMLSETLTPTALSFEAWQAIYAAQGSAL